MIITNACMSWDGRDRVNRIVCRGLGFVNLLI